MLFQAHVWCLNIAQNCVRGIALVCGGVVLRAAVCQVQECDAGQRCDEEYDVEPAVVEGKVDIAEHVRNNDPSNAFKRDKVIVVKRSAMLYGRAACRSAEHLLS
jgi:hypothetical protein